MGGMGGSGGGMAMIHGCTLGTATNLTGNAAVTINDTSPWDFNHAACVIVDKDTVVTWEGNFNTHPLRGGTTPTPDAGNPIEIAGAVSGTTPVDVTFANIGTFPYYCGMHVATMKGVVYVQ
jgi:plastocyanin